MEPNVKKLLYDMLRTSSPSGSEEHVIDMFREFVAPYVDECYLDVNGNCIAHKKGAGAAVMLMAHADEVGLMISYIDDNGFLYFKEIGGIDTNLLPGQRVRIEGDSGAVIGVIGKKPIHLQEKSEGSKELKPEDLWIDIAACDREDAESKVQVGSIATIVSEPSVVNDPILASKSLDDKVGLAVLASVAQKSSDIEADLYLVASVQEELGSRGAQPVSEAISPEIGIAIDVTHATDYPTMSPIKDGSIALGKGVVIGIGPNMNKSISTGLKKIAGEFGIAFQLEALAKPTGTDARMIQTAGSGIRTGLLSIPCRYMHTPNEMVSLDDADAAAELIIAYLKTYHNQSLFNL